MVKFIIGKAPEKIGEFLIHKEVACYYSPVFNAAFNNDLVEGQSFEYRIDDTTGEVFEILITWLYSQTFYIPEAKSTTEKTLDIMTDLVSPTSTLIILFTQNFTSTSLISLPSAILHALFREFELILVSWKILLWILADELGIPALQNDTMVRLRDI